MSIPEPPSVSGIISSDYGDNKFFSRLFSFYALITPKFNKKRVNGLQREMNALKNVKAQAFSGISLELGRTVSPNFQIKHSLLLSGTNEEVPSYTNMVQYETHYQKLASHLWGNFGIGTQFAPSLGNIKTKLSSSFVLTKEAHEPAPKNPNSLSFELSLNSVANWEELDQTPFVEGVSVSFDMPGSSISTVFDIVRSSFQCTMNQQLARKHFAGITFYAHPTPPFPAGLAATYRYESKRASEYPRNHYTASANANTIAGLASIGGTYSRIYSPNFSWTSELEYGSEITSSTGFDYHFRIFNLESAIRCIINHKGEANCNFSDVIGPLNYSISSTIDLPKNDFSFGLGFDIALD